MEYAICADLEGDHFAFVSHFDSPRSISAAPRPLPALSSCNGGGDNDDDGDEEVYIDTDFQFHLLLTDLKDDGRLIPADKIFFQGRIRPLYPFFDDDDDDDDAALNEEENGSPVAAHEALRLQTSKGVAPENHCAWPPRSAGQHKKWPSMGGFLQRWQLGDLIFKRHRNGRKEKQEPPPAAAAAVLNETEKKAGKKKKKAVEKRKDKKRRQ